MLSVAETPDALEDPVTAGNLCRVANAQRVFDVVIASAALLVAAGPMLVAALAVRLSSPGPVIFRSTRIGRGGRPFRIMKFRTMRADAPANGAGVTQFGDPRITRVGAVLRRWKLDELPQFLNVLRGDMSIVGPRPEDPRYVAHYTPEQRFLLTLRPGITSAASVAYSQEEKVLAGAANIEQAYLNQVLPAKLRIDLEYFHRRSLWSDLRIIFHTFSAIQEPGDRE